jgi:hypothetical protein
MRLFEIAAQYRALEALAESEDMAPEFIADTLDSLTGDFEVKAVAVAKFILGVEAESDAIKEAAAAMTLRAERLSKRAESIRAYLLLQFIAMNWKKINNPELVITRRDNPPAVQISNDLIVPGSYWVQPPAPPPRIDKRAVKEALTAGKDVPGCHLQSGERIEIRL